MQSTIRLIRTTSTPSTRVLSTVCRSSRNAVAYNTVRCILTSTSSLSSSSSSSTSILAGASKHCISPIRPFARFYASAGVEVIKVPSMGDSISEGQIAKIHKKPGDAVKVDEPVISIETDKVSIDVPAPFAGSIAEVMVAEGDTVPVGKELFSINKGAAGAASASKPAAAAPSPSSSSSAPPPPPPSSSSAAPSKPAESKPQAATPPPAQESKPAPSSSSSSAAAAASKPKPVVGDRSETKVKMTPMRRKIAQRLKESQNTAAMLTTFQECDMSGLMQLRSQFAEEFQKKHGIKLGFMSCFIKASSAALQDQPIVNAVMQDDSIIYKNYNDISVAVATPRGLVVPVLRNCETKTMADLEKELGELGQKAKKDQIAIEDMVGGTFTISNGGVYGSMMGTPIINPPQSAILGMHGIVKRAVVVNDKIEIRPMMYLALTYDHRLIDGREAVTFLKKVREYVEDPRRLLLDL